VTPHVAWWRALRVMGKNALTTPTIVSYSDSVLPVLIRRYTAWPYALPDLKIRWLICNLLFPT